MALLHVVISCDVKSLGRVRERGRDVLMEEFCSDGKS